ncbi:MAG: hypothetical protein ACU0CI_02665 [Shimia sp.]
MLRALIAVLCLIAAPLWAHGLNVFASVEGEEVVVEAKFSNGRAPVSGEVRVSDDAGELIETLELGEDGTLRFPLDPVHAATGLLIEVEASDGHDNYWILTPDDIARGQGEGS